MLQNAAGVMIAKAYDQWYEVNFKTPHYLLTKREMSRRPAGRQASKQEELDKNFCFGIRRT
jgi:hypothetical protein